MRYSIALSDVKPINEKFNAELQRQIDGTLPKGHVYQLGEPSVILVSAGIDDLPIELAASRLVDKSMQENHPFDLSEVRDLVNAIQQPLAVFRSATHVGSFVVLTQIKHDDRNFVAAMTVNANKDKLDVNSIRSLHYRNSLNILGWINDGLANYISPSFNVDFIDDIKRNLLSKPQYNSVEVRKKISDAANVVKSFENPKLPEPTNAIQNESNVGDRYSFNVRGNSGYTMRDDGKTYLSNRASDAEYDGSFPKAQFKKAYGLSSKMFDAFLEMGFIKNTEWHHTGTGYKETLYYTWADGIRAGGNVDYSNDTDSQDFQEGSIYQSFIDNQKEIVRLLKVYETSEFKYKPKRARYRASDTDIETYARLNASTTNLSRELQDKMKAEHEQVSEKGRTGEIDNPRLRALMHGSIDDKYLAMDYDRIINDKSVQQMINGNAEHERVMNEEIDTYNKNVDEENKLSDGKEKIIVQIAKLLGKNDEEAYSIAEETSKTADEEKLQMLMHEKEKELAELNRQMAEAKLKDLEDWVSKNRKKGNIEDFTRLKEDELPQFYLETKREMNGKYGWFAASSTYRLPEYISGLSFKTKRLLDTYNQKYDDYYRTRYRSTVDDFNSYRDELYAKHNMGERYSIAIDGERSINRIYPSSATMEEIEEMNRNIRDFNDKQKHETAKTIRDRIRAEFENRRDQYESKQAFHDAYVKAADEAVMSHFDNTEWKPIAYVPTDIKKVHDWLIARGWNGVDNKTYATEAGYISHHVVHHEGEFTGDVDSDGYDMQQNFNAPYVIGYTDRQPNSLVYVRRDTKGRYFATIITVGENGHLTDGRVNWQTDFAKEKNPYKKLIPIWTSEFALQTTGVESNAPEGADQISEYKDTNSSSESSSSEENSSIQNESKNRKRYSINPSSVPSRVSASQILRMRWPGISANKHIKRQLTIISANLSRVFLQLKTTQQTKLSIT